jgi:peptide-methionine (S)-S-oxide reductase
MIPKKERPVTALERGVNTEIMAKEIATLAGGCFWGVEELIRALPGVLNTEVGYTGGLQAAPKYEEVKTGVTGHAEAIRVEFDPLQISYEDLLLFFFKIHDPTTRNRQGNDRGSQYRSVIFYHSNQQRDVAEKVRDRVQAAKAWSGDIVTEIVEANDFYNAESYHQDYLQKNPGGYTCHFIRKIDF